MDGITLFAVTNDLRGLIGGKIMKIQQPENEMVLLSIRANQLQHRLLLCAHPENGRVQLTKNEFSNPSQAPSFCMLLRKRLAGGYLRSVVQDDTDRILRLEFDARDELGDTSSLCLIVELMGRYSNIALVNDEGVVLDCIRHVNAGMSSVRILLPGVRYVSPPSQDKLNPFKAGETDFLKAVEDKGVLYKLLMSKFFGLCPDSAKGIVQNWAGEPELNTVSISRAEKQALARYLFRLFQALYKGELSPCLVYDDEGEPLKYYPFSIEAKQAKSFPAMSEALDVYYNTRDKLESFRRKSASLTRILKNNLERCQKKLGLYLNALNSEEDLKLLRLYGELILANTHSLKRGQSSATLDNYYADPAESVTVTLDPLLTPQENASAYFKRYAKGKSAKALATEQIKSTSEEIEYLEGQLHNLSKCDTDEELSEIKEELIKEGYIKRETKKGAAVKLAPSKPLHFISSDGCHMYVGRNNRQNDALTLKFASASDWWFHTKNIPGSHVIVKCEGDLPDQTLKEAALLAVSYSKANASSPVDYCQKKFVKKPQGARPGMVVYTTNRTIYVSPDMAAVKKLARGESGASL